MRRKRQTLALLLIAAAASVALIAATSGTAGGTSSAKGPSGYVGKGGDDDRQGRRVRRDLQGAVDDARARALQSDASADGADGAQHLAGRVRPLDEDR